MANPNTLISSSPTSLFIPHEILREILSHCDMPTLAAVSRANLACLELASPFLYKDIVLEDVSSVMKLFRLEPSHGTALVKSRRVTPHTSLSLIRSLTFHAKESTNFGILTSFPSPVRTMLSILRVSLVPRPDIKDYNLVTLLALVDPSTFILEGPTGPEEVHPSDFDLNALGILHMGQPAEGIPAWSRLSNLILKNVHINIADIHLMCFKDWSVRLTNDRAITNRLPVLVIADLRTTSSMAK